MKEIICVTYSFLVLKFHWQCPKNDFFKGKPCIRVQGDSLE